jgi:hypothetical protein
MSKTMQKPVLNTNFETQHLTPIGEYLNIFMLPNTTIGSAMVNGLTHEVRFVTITPAIAKKILEERNLLNRKFSPTNINLMANSMKNGVWQFNGDTVRFNSEGVLSDGQNRLMAIIKSNTVQICLVISGIDVNAFETIDIGFGRSASDILSIYDVPNPTPTSQIVKFVFSWRAGKYSANRNTVRNLSNQEVMPYYGTLVNIQNSVDFVLAKMKDSDKLVTRTTLGGFHYEMSLIDKKKADEFIEKLCTGANLDSDSPIYALRAKLSKAKRNSRYKLTNKVMLQYIVLAWNYFRSDAKIKSLQISKDFVMKLK